MTKRRQKRHRPEEIVAKLRDADAMLNAGKDPAAVLQALKVSESTLAAVGRSEPRSVSGWDPEDGEDLRDVFPDPVGNAGYEWRSFHCNSSGPHALVH